MIMTVVVPGEGAAGGVDGAGAAQDPLTALTQLPLLESQALRDTSKGEFTVPTTQNSPKKNHCTGAHPVLPLAVGR